MTELLLQRGLDAEGRNTLTVSELLQVLRDADIAIELAAAMLGTFVVGRYVEIRGDGTFAPCPAEYGRQPLAESLDCVSELLTAIKAQSSDDTPQSSDQLDRARSALTQDQFDTVSHALRKSCRAFDHDVHIEVDGKDYILPIPHRAAIHCISDRTADPVIANRTIIRIAERYLLHTSDGGHFLLIKPIDPLLVVPGGRVCIDILGASVEATIARRAAEEDQP